MQSKRIFLLVLTAAVIMQTRAAEDDDDDGGTTTSEPLPKPEAVANKDGAISDANGEETSENNEPAVGTSSATVEKTATTAGDSATPPAPEDAYFLRGDDNTICVAIKFQVMLEIHIPSNDSIPTKNVNLDKENYPIYGDCGEGNLKPRLTIEVEEDINVTFAFETIDNEGSWTLSAMELEVNSANLFNMADESTLQTLTPKELPAFAAPIGQSFECSDHSKVTFVNEEGSVAAYCVVDSIKLQAIHVPADFGPERTCFSNPVSASKRIEQRSDSTPISHGTDAIPIAIVLAMAILTLFGITGYAIHRMTHQKEHDYPEFYAANNKL